MHRRMDAAGAVGAKNASTAPWKTDQNAVSHTVHTHHRFQQKHEENESRQPALHTKFRTIPRGQCAENEERYRERKPKPRTANQELRTGNPKPKNPKPKTN